MASALMQNINLVCYLIYY